MEIMKLFGKKSETEAESEKQAYAQSLAYVATGNLMCLALAELVRCTLNGEGPFLSALADELEKRGHSEMKGKKL